MVYRAMRGKLLPPILTWNSAGPSGIDCLYRPFESHGCDRSCVSLLSKRERKMRSWDSLDAHLRMMSRKRWPMEYIIRWIFIQKFLAKKKEASWLVFQVLAKIIIIGYIVIMVWVIEISMVAIERRTLWVDKICGNILTRYFARYFAI